MDNILVIDGHNFIWRSNITFAPRKDKKEEKFVTVYNFFRNLRAIIEELEPTKVFFVLEGRPKKRYALFPDYKANRIVKNATKQSTMDKFHTQKEIILNLLEHLPINLVSAVDYEADDVIATLVDNLKDEQVIVLSNDSDFIQLLQKGYKNLKIYNPFSKKYMEAPSYHYLAWKCLRGDKKTDNIPGLVSDAKAVKLISNPKELETFLSSDENKANFNLNKELIELNPIPEEELLFGTYKTNFKLLKQEFEKMEFSSMLTDKYWERFVETFEDLR